MIKHHMFHQNEKAKNKINPRTLLKYPIPNNFKITAIDTWLITSMQGIEAISPVMSNISILGGLKKHTC